MGFILDYPLGVRGTTSHQARYITLAPERSKLVEGGLSHRICLAEHNAGLAKKVLR